VVKRRFQQIFVVKGKNTVTLPFTQFIDRFIDINSFNCPGKERRHLADNGR